MTTKTKKEVKAEPKFDYTTIKTFEDACKKLGMDPEKLPVIESDEFRKPIIAAYKLMIVYKAINNGWKPNWGRWRESKYYPWYEVLSSGFGFSITHYFYACTFTSVGSRLCTDSSEKALYIAEQFKDLYVDYLLYSE